MLRSRTIWLWPLLLATAASACTIRDDSTRPNQLESLRVLGIRSEPADLVSGETATLSALVYEPNEKAVSYNWSWCPSRNGKEEGYTCAIAEADLQAAWAQLDTGLTLPPYDLGTGETAELDFAISEELAYSLCEAITADEEDAEVALFTCLMGLGLSVSLEVRTDAEEVVSIKRIPTRGKDEARNLNPDPSGAITVTAVAESRQLEPGEALRAALEYILRIDIAPDQSETFLPEEQPGADPPEPRGETLTMTWFVTQGATHREGSQRTEYVDDFTEFEDLLENTWEMPFDLDSDVARLFLVLRDERGGMGWAEHSFTVEEAQ